MRDARNAFHLAIPARDLDEAYSFYVEGLGCHLARRYGDRITVDFFGDQVVCHLHDVDTTEPVELYPRHFGVTFATGQEFDDLLRLVEIRKLPVFRPVALRFEGTVEEHRTVVLIDPSRNLLEFKHYRDPRMMF
ncbi:MAG TPA: VOC family protein [Mycobacteriales bacterium]